MDIRCPAHTGDPELDEKLQKGAPATAGAVTPGAIRSRLEMIQAEISSLEADLAGPISKGVVGLTEVRHELVEGSDALHRAVETLDRNYSSMS